MAKNKEDFTHVELHVKTKKRLEKMRDELGLRSMAILVQQILDGKIKIKQKNKKDN